MWKILQHKTPDDYVLSTGKQHSIKEFINLVARKLKMKIKWTGKGINEKCYSYDKKKFIIECDKTYFRPLDVENLLGNSNKARRVLKWKPRININKLIDEMLSHELKKIDNGR